MQSENLLQKIEEFKKNLEALMIDENASPNEILKASQELDVLITEFYQENRQAVL